MAFHVFLSCACVFLLVCQKLYLCNYFRNTRCLTLSFQRVTGVSAKRTGRLVSLRPSFGVDPSERLQFLGRPASLGSGCEFEWSSSVHTKRGLMWFLSYYLEGRHSFGKQTQSLLPVLSAVSPSRDF